MREDFRTPIDKRLAIERSAISGMGYPEQRLRAKRSSGLWKWLRSVAKSAFLRWSQPVDATLYLREKRWSAEWNEDFIEVLLRQRRRSYGIAGSAGSR